MARSRPNAPPPRHGVSAGCVVLPAGPWATVFEYLLERFSSVPPETWRVRLGQGDVIDDQGITLRENTPYQAHQRVYYYRAVETEPAIPFEEAVLWEDEHLVVVDKPHFLPVMPSGKYLQETVLVRLKNRLGLSMLSPIHRIDRDTAGLVLFAKQAATRSAYQNLFRDRAVHKTYHAIAPWAPELPWPLERRSRIVCSSHFMQQTEVEGVANSLTHVSPLEIGVRYARYQLSPVTGQRHQLRVHMAALGLPLVGDGIYPTLTAEDQTDYANPLQLLAFSMSFTDPITQKAHSFESKRRLRSLSELENP
ncbi:pseudouridine synthase [Rhodoferax aquaticus]|uniref:Pseudouridine synthase n=1 Tax=Rhodoferax aquaticus TaxID=2527691 RepID=A0A515EPD3_9BURK|nr:pseudouridine synthase [Rhodoferax aquaticus]QDL54490.1 pseudouridine synthase [Rhodoferax aquaticus]